MRDEIHGWDGSMNLISRPHAHNVVGSHGRIKKLLGVARQADWSCSGRIQTHSYIFGKDWIYVGPTLFLQNPRVVGDVVGHEACHEAVGVVVARLVAERQRDVGGGEGFLEQMRFQLLVEKIVA